MVIVRESSWPRSAPCAALFENRGCPNRSDRAAMQICIACFADRRAGPDQVGLSTPNGTGVRRPAMIASGMTTMKYTIIAVIPAA